MSPAIKAMRQSLSSLLKSSKPPSMPLMPAIRPVNSISRTAERPIRPPPIAADIGVKLTMTLPDSCRARSLMTPSDNGSQARHAQSQCVADDAHRRQRHTGGGHDRRQQEAEMGIENICRNLDVSPVLER